MPVRLLREGINDSEAVSLLSFPAEVFYRRLMSAVDDFGRFDGRPAVLRSRLYPLKIDVVREADISRWIAECEKAGLIALYHTNSKPYILFGKLGSPRAKESKYPAPPPDVEKRLNMAAAKADENVCAQTRADENECAQTRASAPYSYSSSGTSTSSNTNHPPNPPQPGGTIPSSLDTPAFREAWSDWIAERAAKRVKPYTAKGAAALLAKLAAAGEAEAIRAIRDSIAQGWQGLFPKQPNERKSFETQDERNMREMAEAINHARSQRNEPDSAPRAID